MHEGASLNRPAAGVFSLVVVVRFLVFVFSIVVITPGKKSQRAADACPRGTLPNLRQHWIQGDREHGSGGAVESDAGQFRLDRP
jgi:hypothetical protein